MKKEQNYGSRFLYAEDLLIGGEFRTVDLVISGYHEPGTIKSADGRLIDKPTIEFQGKQKMLVLCKTNASVIHFATGEPAGQKWIGHHITLQPRMVEAFGDEVVALRVMPPQGCTIRKSILKRLGTKATWTNGSGNGKPKPQQPRKPTDTRSNILARLTDVSTPDQLADVEYDIQQAKERDEIDADTESELYAALNARGAELTEGDFALERQ